MAGYISAEKRLLELAIAAAAGAAAGLVGATAAKKYNDTLKEELDDHTIHNNKPDSLPPGHAYHPLK